MTAYDAPPLPETRNSVIFREVLCTSQVSYIEDRLTALGLTRVDDDLPFPEPFTNWFEVKDSEEWLGLKSIMIVVPRRRVGGIARAINASLDHEMESGPSWLRQPYHELRAAMEAHTPPSTYGSLHRPILLEAMPLDNHTTAASIMAKSLDVLVASLPDPSCVRYHEGDNLILVYISGNQQSEILATETLLALNGWQAAFPQRYRGYLVRWQGSEWVLEDEQSHVASQAA